MRRLPLPLLPFLFVGCQFSASCGNKNLDMAKGREFVSTALESAVGQKPSTVTCPEKVLIAKDATFECTAAFGTATANVAIVQTDDKGGVSVTSVTGVLIAAKLEKEIADSLGQRMGSPVTVSCGDRIRPAVAGGKFLCEAKNAEGGTGKIEVTVTDATGKVSWAAVPSARDEPPAGVPDVAPTPAPEGSASPDVDPAAAGSAEVAPAPETH